MKKSLHTLLAAFSAIALLGAGCGATSETPTTNTQGSATAPTDSGRVANVDGCTHEYHPLREGHAITYSARMATKTSEFTYRVKSVSGNKAMIEYDFGNDSKIEVEFECSSEGIRALTQVDFSKAFGGSMGAMTSQTKSATGELVPKDFHVGSEWSQTFESEAQIQNEEMQKMGMSNITTTMKMNHKAVGEESVTVPAGTFTAIKVETEMMVTTKMSPTTPPSEFKTKTTSYWVKDIGMVRSVSGEGNAETLMEATKITK